jgi:hypothetical protein
MTEEPSDHETILDPLLHLLDQQLKGVHCSLLVCKWPVTLMSCFFVTMLCWDMAGDKGGWLQALWVPIVGAVMALVIWVSDRQLMTATLHGSWSPHFSSCSRLCPSSNRNTDPADSLELVHSSLHHTPAAAAQDLS